MTVPEFLELRRLHSMLIEVQDVTAPNTEARTRVVQLTDRFEEFMHAIAHGNTITIGADEDWAGE